MSSFTAAKAHRLIAAGQVTVHPGPAQVFDVQGDHATYLVTVTASVQTCSCPSVSRPCSHIEAAIKQVLAPNPVAPQRPLGRNSAAAGQDRPAAAPLTGAPS